MLQMSGHTKSSLRMEHRSLSRLFVSLAVWALPVAGCNDQPATHNTPAATAHTAPTVPATRANALESCSRADAQEVLDRSTVMADVTEGKKGTIYRFKGSWWDTVRPQAHQLIEGISDADACLHPSARLILFYDPSGSRIGVADPVRGISMAGQ